MVAPLVAAAGISAGASLLGGLFGKSSAKEANKASAKEGKLSRDFTKEQMQNARQWEAKDLEKAGLNRILGMGGSPPTGSSAMAQQIDTGKGGKESALAGATMANLAADTYLKMKSADNQESQSKLTDTKDDQQGRFSSLYRAGGQLVDKGVSSAKNAFAKAKKKYAPKKPLNLTIRPQGPHTLYKRN